MASEPTQAGFLAWVRSTMQVPPEALPDDSEWITSCYDLASAQVNCTLRIIPIAYTFAVYNLAGDYLINWAADLPDQTFFTKARESYHVNQFVAGVVASTGDNGTSTSLLNPEFLRGLTMGQLSNLNTPFGRQYLALAQAYGPTQWGLS